MKAFAFMLLALLSAHCVAREAPPAADDLALERRVVKLTSDLRCLVCQNQSLADSHADLAIDLKNQVRDQMRAGRSDAEIRDYMVARYGDFVLYDPPFKLSTVLLWMGPFVFLLLGLAALGSYLRSRRRRLPQREMTPADHARAEALLRGNPAGREPQ
jgi:cytochrome c-type biogenesis protein CcmH